MFDDDRGQIILGIIVLVLSIVVLIFVGWVYVFLTDAVFNSLTLAELDSQLGTDPSGTVMFFGGFAFILFAGGLIYWFIQRPIGQDVRQSTQRRF